MEATVEREGTNGIVRLVGRFDLHANTTFRKAYRPLLVDAAVRELVLDLGGVDFIDSLALGQLLLAHQDAEKAGKATVLANCRPPVRKVIEIANFHKILKLR